MIHELPIGASRLADNIVHDPSIKPSCFSEPHCFHGDGEVRAGEDVYDIAYTDHFLPRKQFAAWSRHLVNSIVGISLEV